MNNFIFTFSLSLSSKPSCYWINSILRSLSGLQRGSDFPQEFLEFILNCFFSLGFILFHLPENSISLQGKQIKKRLRIRRQHCQSKAAGKVRLLVFNTPVIKSLIELCWFTHIWKWAHHFNISNLRSLLWLADTCCHREPRASYSTIALACLWAGCILITEFGRDEWDDGELFAMHTVVNHCSWNSTPLHFQGLFATWTF